MKAFRFIALVLAIVLVFGLAYYMDHSPSAPAGDSDIPFTRPTEPVLLKDKIILNFGDSIFGNYKAPNDISSHLENKTKATVYNVAFGGCRMSVHPTEQYHAFSMYALANAIAQNDWAVQEAAMARQDWTPHNTYAGHLKTLQSVDFEKVDIITIAYGTNDFAGKVPMDNPEDIYDTTTFGGALRYSIETISKAYPNIKIVICTPIYRFWIDKENNNAYLYDSESYVVENNKLTDFVDLCKSIAKQYNLLCIDNYSGSGLCYDNRSECFPETSGVHPNQTGLKMIAKYMADVLLEKYT